MPNINPFHDLLLKRNIKLMNERSYGIKLVTVCDESLRGNFVYPGINTTARIEVTGLGVGEIDYGINPLGDRLYIKTLEVRPGYRFRGVALGSLWQLWQTHQVPIVPLLQDAGTRSFWVKARRRFAAAGAEIEPDLQIDDLDRAKQRWAHLIPPMSPAISSHKPETPINRPYLRAEIFGVNGESGPAQCSD